MLSRHCRTAAILIHSWVEPNSDKPPWDCGWLWEPCHRGCESVFVENCVVSAYPTLSRNCTRLHLAVPREYLVDSWPTLLVRLTRRHLHTWHGMLKLEYASNIPSRKGKSSQNVGFMVSLISALKRTYITCVTHRPLHEDFEISAYVYRVLDPGLRTQYCSPTNLQNVLVRLIEVYFKNIQTNRARVSPSGKC